MGNLSLNADDSKQLIEFMKLNLDEKMINKKLEFESYVYNSSLFADR
jgi:hypothetical protein